MALDLRPTGPEDLEPLVAFLMKHFRVTADAPIVNREQMKWKFWEPRPDWVGSRSYVLASGSRWLSHVAACPMPMDTANGVVTGALLVDWVSASPGAGAEGFRRCYGLMNVIYGQGGSSSARATMLNLGFRTEGEVTHFARTLRPFGRFQAGQGDWKRRMMRLGRDVAVSALPLHAVPKEWSCVPITEFKAEHEALIGPRPHSFTQTTRSVGLLNYLLRCPIAKVTAHGVYRGGRPMGYFLLSRTPRGLLLADQRLASEVPEDWSVLLALATRATHQDPDAHVFLVASSLPLLDQAARANRFREFMKDPLFIHDPSGKLAGVKSLHITPMDGDQGYL